MSFTSVKEIVDEGDVATLYLGPNNAHTFEVKEKIVNKKGEDVDNILQTIYGALKIISLVGQKYGSKVELSRGWGYILQPTPELWTVTLPHRTQIIYTPDISLIIHMMDLCPGRIVIETGTGSGSLSHSLIRAVRPSGHLYTFDFHANRVAAAEYEFLKHGLGKYVTLEQRDVCLNGFGENLNHKAHAVFLDLPHPWMVIAHAAVALQKSGGKLCSFSPCIEQVQRTCQQLVASGFIEIKTFECLQREMNVHYKNLPVLSLECLRYKQQDKETQETCPDKEKTKQGQEKLLTVSHGQSVPGHTGFITIATLPPDYVRKYRLLLNRD